MTTNIVYNCPAVPPDGIMLTKQYEFGKDKNGYFYKDANRTVYAEIDYIKMLFAPVKGVWDDILAK